MQFDQKINELLNNLTFLLQFITAPKIIGAVLPSSPQLSEVITSWVDLKNADSVVEFGPGTGAFTGTIKRKLKSGATFIAIEINPEMVKILGRNFPDVTVYNDSVLNTASYLTKHGHGKTDCIISGLPWAIFSDEEQTQILDIVSENLKAGGQFVTFAYLHGMMLPSGRRFRKKLSDKFPEVTCSKIVWQNFPPALVYQARK
jgi:phosphatidylethanolamine/phosphatidyl-N-methylethanolamine N-methyltransferase